MDQLTICLIIFVLTVIGYCFGIWSLATVSMLSMVALTLTGCLTPAEALANFSNNNAIMIAGMCIVAAGFNRTQFCTNVAKSISKVAKGSLTKLMFGYAIVGMLLGQFIQSPAVVIGIIGPMCAASAEAMGLSPSKVIFPIGLVTIATCCTLPVGAGATVAAEFNAYIEAYGYTAHTAQMTDAMVGRLPLLIITILYATFIAPKFAPDTAPVAIAASTQKSVQREPLKPMQEWAGIIIFFVDAAALMFASQIGLQNWQITVLGAIAMIVFGVLKPAEASKSIPVSMLLLIVGSLAMAGALSSTGAGEVIGGAIAQVVTDLGGNSYLVGAIFFIVPLLLTQIMSNRGCMMIFHPIAIATAASVGGNPVGLMILIQAACLASFMTPMATPAVPYIMDMGGYNQTSLIKQSWLYMIIACVVSVGWTMTFFPIL